MTGQIVLADSMLPTNIKKEQPQRCGSLDCSAFSQLTKQRLFQKDQAAKMYSILFNSEYICQGGKLQRRPGSKRAFK